MDSLSPWLFFLLVAVGAVVAMLILFPRRRPEVKEDSYTQGLELWLAGDLAGAQNALREAIQKDPDAVDPYLQLGNLLRESGDAKRAAVLHRGLTVRSDIPKSKRISISLALVDDLVSLGQWAEVGSVLDSLSNLADSTPRIWQARFAQNLGQKNEKAAAKALQTGAARCAGKESELFRYQHGLFQLDRALRSCQEDRTAEARQLLKDIPVAEDLKARVTFVRALIAAQDEGPERAASIAMEGLMDAPQEMELFLPALQQALLDSGHYERTIPILETACQSNTAPVSLWMALALLYEKMDQRQKAIQLLERKAKDPALVPDAVAPLLKLLAADQPEADWSRIWQTLLLPAVGTSWRCTRCDRFQPEVRWFCPACHSFASYTSEPLKEEGNWNTLTRVGTEEATGA